MAQDDRTRPPLGGHPLDPVSLVAGLLALAVALVALFDLDVDGGLVLPVLLLGAGTAGLAVAVRRGRSSTSSDRP